MASNNRQTNLFAVEDWKKLYTTFSEADFQAYDFETIRKVMVDYLRTYYAEDYNDFIAGLKRSYEAIISKNN